MRLDMQIDQQYDTIRNNKNKIWRLHNEQLKLAQENGRRERKIIELKKQQYGLKGRAWVKLEEDKK